LEEKLNLKNVFKNPAVVVRGVQDELCFGKFLDGKCQVVAEKEIHSNRRKYSREKDKYYYTHFYDQNSQTISVSLPNFLNEGRKECPISLEEEEEISPNTSAENLMESNEKLEIEHTTLEITEDGNSSDNSSSSSSSSSSSNSHTSK